jgi:hypothetical protein
MVFFLSPFQLRRGLQANSDQLHPRRAGCRRGNVERRLRLSVVHFPAAIHIHLRHKKYCGDRLGDWRSSRFPATGMVMPVQHVNEALGKVWPFNLKFNAL